MSSGPKPVKREIDGAILAVLGSPEWRGARSDAERVQLLRYSILEVLHPISPIHVPSVWTVRARERRERRDVRIRSLFNGRNHQVLAERFRLTTRQIRRIVDRAPSGPAAGRYP